MNNITTDTQIDLFAPLESDRYWQALKRYKGTSSLYRVTQNNKPTVADLLSIGDIITTNYNTGPYRIVKITLVETRHHPPCYSLLMSLPDCKDAHYYIILNDGRAIFSQFGEDVYLSDFVNNCIDRIATEVSKIDIVSVVQKPGSIRQQNDDITRLFRFKPNPLQTTKDFLSELKGKVYILAHDKLIAVNKSTNEVTVIYDETSYANFNIRLPILKISKAKAKKLIGAE